MFSGLGFVEGEAAEAACCGRPVLVLPECYYSDDIMGAMMR